MPLKRIIFSVCRCVQWIDHVEWLKNCFLLPLFYVYVVIFFPELLGGKETCTISQLICFLSLCFFLACIFTICVPQLYKSEHQKTFRVHALCQKLHFHRLVYLNKLMSFLCSNETFESYCIAVSFVLNLSLFIVYIVPTLCTKKSRTET